jgi:ATP-dependent RNA helicase DDX20
VGSPGRLCGLITAGALLVGKVKAVVLDEADQLLSDGFYADTAWLLQQLPKRKQVLAFSATYTHELLGDLEPLMRRPQKVGKLSAAGLARWMGGQLHGAAMSWWVWVGSTLYA